MTNSWAIAERLKRTCTGGHRHIILVGGRAKKAQQYPDELCKEILRGLEEQMRIDGRLRKGLVGAIAPEEPEWNEVQIDDEEEG